MLELYKSCIKIINVKITCEYITKFINLNSKHSYNKALNFVTPYAKHPVLVVKPQCCLLQADSNSIRFLKYITNSQIYVSTTYIYWSI